MRNNSKKVIKLRAHHLICLQGYQGYGYDKSFKLNLENILNELEQIKDIKVKILSSNDDLCDCCPHLKENQCYLGIEESNRKNPSKKEIEESDNRIINMDLAILEKTSIKENKEYGINKLYDIVNNTFQTIEDIQKICGNCRWQEQCLWYQKRERDS
ncbi:MAG: DUF1284 domain-containing protein [Methanobrevibacter sp.]|jgi:hypothetical protein|nr:DUF1284 domain-containing protein [Methanobrevibacter sp.]